MKARILVVVYLLSRIAGDAHVHGVRATPEVIADLLVDDLSDAASVRARVPNLLAALAAERTVIEVGDGEWRLQTKESADWLSAYDKAAVDETGDPSGTARQRASLLEQTFDDALTGAGQVVQGVSKVPRRIERVIGDAKPGGDGLTLRLWNGWDHPLPSTLADIRGADVQKDATLHLVVPDHRKDELRDAIVAYRAATTALQRQGVPTTEGGKEAKASMQSRLERAEQVAKAILRDAVERGQVLVAGGAEVGAGLPRADAVREAAQCGLDRLYTDRAGRPRGLGPRAGQGAAEGAGRHAGGRARGRAARPPRLQGDSPCPRRGQEGIGPPQPPHGRAVRLAQGRGGRGTGRPLQRRAGEGHRPRRQAGGAGRPEHERLRHLHLRTRDPRGHG
ncbi:hypothetical protein ACFQU2_04035 [Siccirubricoccus deserti]